MGTLFHSYRKSCLSMRVLYIHVNLEAEESVALPCSDIISVLRPNKLAKIFICPVLNLYLKWLELIWLHSILSIPSSLFLTGLEPCSLQKLLTMF